MSWSPGNERGELVSTVLLHRKRWQYLSQICPAGLATDYPYPSIGGPMPLLQHSNLEFDYEYDTGTKKKNQIRNYIQRDCLCTTQSSNMTDFEAVSLFS
jgi:hypothetical protein